MSILAAPQARTDFRMQQLDETRKSVVGPQEINFEFRTDEINAILDEIEQQEAEDYIRMCEEQDEELAMQAEVNEILEDQELLQELDNDDW